MPLCSACYPPTPPAPNSTRTSYQGVAVAILRWPLGMWSETHLRAFGLSTQTWATWTADRIKNLGVSTGLTAIMVLAVVTLARRFRRWWIPAAIGAFVLTLLASFAYPVVIEPIFNDFRPMAAGQCLTREHPPVDTGDGRRRPV